jgi:DNA-directed RNA polymerase specialized sigma24 family protein
MVGLLEEEFQSPSLTDVLDALERVQTVLTDRQRLELMAMTARATRAVSLDAAPDGDDRPYDLADPGADTERDVQARELERLLDRALGELGVEDAAIARLKYGEGLSLKQIRDALHLDQLTDERVRGILEVLKTRLADRSGGSVASAVPRRARSEGAQR